MTANHELLQQFAQLTPEKRARILEKLKAQGVEMPLKRPPQRSAIPPVDRALPIPLAFPQEQLWFLHQLQPESAAYNERMAVRLEGVLEVDVLAKAIQAVAERHESLRTAFARIEDTFGAGSEGGTAVQMIRPFVPNDYDLIQQTLTNPREATQLAQWVDALSLQPFDLTQAPLWRIALFQVGEDDHLLLFVVHHIIADAWSMAIFLQEVAASYTALRQGALPQWPVLSVTYADFAGWQRQQLQGETLARHLDFWRQSLQGAPLLLPLPGDHSRPPVPSGRGGVVCFTLNQELTQALKRLSRQADATLYMTLLSAFNVLLYRYTGQEDIVVGSVQANRAYPELETVIGHFVNTLALRTCMQRQLTFQELLQQVRTQMQASYEHQALPFQHLVQAIQPERTLGHHPIYQVSFNLHNQPGFDRLSFAGLRVTPFVMENQTSKLDLYLLMVENQGELSGEFEYNRDLFEPATIERMTGHFQTLLASIVTNPNQCLYDLPLLTEAERHQLLVAWNDTAIDYPKDKTIHQLFEEQVARTPDAVAVVFEEQMLTYGELNVCVNKLAYYLQSLGVGPNVLVGICMERSIEMVVGLLGILKAGGAYVPIDPTYPTERLAFMLQDADVPVLLTQSHLQTVLPRTTAHIILLDAAGAQLATQATDNPAPTSQADHLAYVIYTSGSTGQPKGAMNAHRGVVNRLLWMQDEYQLKRDDRVLQKTPFSFDVSVWEFFWPLLTSAQLVIAKPEGHKDPTYLVDVIRRHQITTVHFVPSMLSVFLEAEAVETCTCLRRVICSGEALPYELQERFFDKLPVELHNLYGPTEAAVDVTYWACQPHNPRAIVPIGRPVANTQMYVLDAHLQPVPLGVAGELHIGGVQVGRGYWQRSDLTQAKFIPNPFGPTENPGCLYKTGDLARWLPNGAIEYLGRLDHQVKIRGFRIELGEIEAVLSQHPAVQEAVVIVREDGSPLGAGEKRLVAYVVTRSHVVGNGEQSPTQELRSYVQHKLPDYMVPNAFVPLAALPLSPNGKIDRKALPPPTGDHVAATRTYVAPTTPVEEQLTAIWCATLGLARVGIHENFFDLGGHSLLLLKMHQAIQSAFHRTLAVADLFQYPTVSQFAHYLAQSNHDNTTLMADAQTRADQQRSALQQRRQRLQRK